MKYVIDSSVAFKWVVPEALADKANLLRDDFRNQLHQLLAPDIFPFEIAHALTRGERQGRLAVGQALALWTEVMTTVPQLATALSLSPRAIQISSQMRIGIYDCLYVALAELERCELVTADDKLVKNLQAAFPFVKALSTLP